jgi:hypothetical protein
MTLPQSVREKKEQIKREISQLGIRVLFEIKRVDAKMSAWEHTVKFYDIPSEEQSDKVWEIIRKYHTQWKMESDLEKLSSSTEK